MEFRTTEYQFTHGREPRGLGWWAFEVVGTKQVLLAPRYMAFTHAKRDVASQVKKLGLGRVTLNVCP